MTTPYQVPTRIRATKNCAANAAPAHALLLLSSNRAMGRRFGRPARRGVAQTAKRLALVCDMQAWLHSGAPAAQGAGLPCSEQGSRTRLR